MQMIPFEYLEHTADIKFRAYGRDPEEMLSNAAAALFRTMVDPATIRVKQKWKVDVDAMDLEQLAYKWLNEIIFLFETESSVFSSFVVSLRQNGIFRLEGEIGGEGIDLERHAFENEVKAVTLHQFQIRKDDVWCIQVILDV